MKRKIATNLARLGTVPPDSVSRPKGMPVYLSSVYSFDSVEDLEAVYEDPKKGFIYARMENPAHKNLAGILAACEETESAAVFSTGMAAITTTLFALLQPGDHLLADNALYGGTFELIKEEMKQRLVDVTFFNMESENLEELFNPRTRLVYTETISNPLMNVPDLALLGRMAHSHNAKLVVDNTFASPVICRPAELGADLVLHSATKYICGHSDVMGGIVAGDEETISEIHRKGVLYGSTLSPFDSWLLTRSMRTLQLRMNAHSRNALFLAEFLQQHNRVRKVYYPGLRDSASYGIARNQFQEGLFGGMLSLELKGGRSEADDLIRELSEIKLVPSLAGFSTSMSYPARTSHRSLTDAELESAGITPGMLRLSAGLENSEDIVQEIDEALGRIK